MSDKKSRKSHFPKVVISLLIILIPIRIADFALDLFIDQDQTLIPATIIMIALVAVSVKQIRKTIIITLLTIFLIEFSWSYFLISPSNWLIPSKTSEFELIWKFNCRYGDSVDSYSSYESIIGTYNINLKRYFLFRRSSSVSLDVSNRYFENRKKWESYIERTYEINFPDSAVQVNDYLQMAENDEFGFSVFEREFPNFTVKYATIYRK